MYRKYAARLGVLGPMLCLFGGFDVRVFLMWRRDQDGIIQDSCSLHTAVKYQLAFGYVSSRPWLISLLLGYR
jgi:hypothetical protein